MQKTRTGRYSPPKGQEPFETPKGVAPSLGAAHPTRRNGANTHLHEAALHIHLDTKVEPTGYNKIAGSQAHRERRVLMKKIAFKRFEREAREIDPCDFCKRNTCFGCPHSEVAND